MNGTACCQCGKVPAIYQINGNPLCLDCAHKAEQINHMKQAQYAQQINYLTAGIEATVGLPGIFPRYEISKPPPIIKNQGGVTLHNITVSQSVVGVINTSNIGQIDVALTNIKAGGTEETVKIIKEFTEAVLEEQRLNIDIKNEIIEHLSFLTKQAALPQAGQEKSLIKLILNTIKKSIEGISSLLILFEAFRKIFGL